MGYEIFNISKLESDFIAIHPQFEDYIEVKKILDVTYYWWLFLNNIKKKLD